MAIDRREFCRKKVRGVYAIIDPEVGAGKEPLKLLRQTLEAGVTVVQLRAKKLPAGEMVNLAREMATLCDKRGAAFIVNDRLDVALASGAHGAHLGQDDLPASRARSISGNSFLLGISTHSVEEAKKAEFDDADYVGFGSMYTTSTKNNVSIPQGIDNLIHVVKSVSIPVVAIGGIGADNLLEIRGTGCACAAVISSISASSNPEEAARSMVRLWKK